MYPGFDEQVVENVELHFTSVPNDTTVRANSNLQNLVLRSGDIIRMPGSLKVG